MDSLDGLLKSVITTSHLDVVPWEDLDRDRPVVLSDGRRTSAEAGESRSARAPQYGVAAPAETPVGPKSASAILAIVSIPRLAALIVSLLLVSGCVGAFVLGWSQGTARPGGVEVAVDAREETLQASPAIPRGAAANPSGERNPEARVDTEGGGR